jgi:hypothetical protein
MMSPPCTTTCSALILGSPGGLVHQRLAGLSFTFFGFILLLLDTGAFRGRDTFGSEWNLASDWKYVGMTKIS